MSFATHAKDIEVELLLKQSMNYKTLFMDAWIIQKTKGKTFRAGETRRASNRTGERSKAKRAEEAEILGNQNEWTAPKTDGEVSTNT